MINPDLILWRRVLVVALQDAKRGDDVDWLASDDFDSVCHLADMDPDAVLRAFYAGRFMETARPRKAA